MTGKLYGLGLGPGDPELMTLKAHRILTSVSVIAYPAPDTGPSFARQIAAPYLRADQLEVPMIVPMRVERYPAQEIYDAAAVTLSHHLDAGSDVAVLCEGDPFSTARSCICSSGWRIAIRPRSFPVFRR